MIPVLPPSPTVAGDLLSSILTSKTFSDKEKAAMIALVGSDIFPDYATVGNIYFIEDPEKGKYRIELLTDSALNQQQLPAIENALSTENFSVFAAAHSHICGCGYMNAICPTVTCPPFTSEN
jgi:hypothetical protein